MTEMTPLSNGSPARLLGFITEVEQAIAERSVINERIAEIYAVADSEGFDKKAMREVIRIRKMEPDKFKQFEQTRDLYLSVVNANVHV